MIEVNRDVLNKAIYDSGVDEGRKIERTLIRQLVIEWLAGDHECRECHDHALARLADWLAF